MIMAVGKPLSTCDRTGIFNQETSGREAIIHACGADSSLDRSAQ